MRKRKKGNGGQTGTISSVVPFTGHIVRAMPKAHPSKTKFTGCIINGLCEGGGGAMLSMIASVTLNGPISSGR